MNRLKELVVALLLAVMLRLKESRFAQSRIGVAVAAKISGMLGAIIVLIAGIYMTPIIAHEVDNVIFQNASDWNFTGHSGAEALMGLIPFVWIAALVILVVAILFALAKS